MEVEITKQVEGMRDKIEAIQKGMEALRKTGLKEDVLIMLIQKNSQKFTCLRNNNLKLDDVKAIVRGIETLPAYIFGKTKAKVPS